MFMIKLSKPKESTIKTEETNKEVSNDDSDLSFCMDVSGKLSLLSLITFFFSNFLIK